jgi:hypothetical protein
MPIRLNLLAETQALEELRRRDPVKRTLWVGLLLVLLLLVWSSSLQLKAMIARGDLSRVEAQLQGQTNSYQQVILAQRKLADVNHRLAALQQLTTNRLLYGTLLNSLQQSTVDAIQIVRLRTEQVYVLNEEVKARTNANNRLVPGKPASVTERIVVALDGKDTALNPGDQIPAFKNAVSKNPYFAAVLGKTNEVRLTSLAPPTVRDAKPSVLFSVECRFPEITR